MSAAWGRAGRIGDAPLLLLVTQRGTRDAWIPGLRERFPPVNCVAQKSRRFVIQGGEELAGTTARRGRF